MPSTPPAKRTGGWTERSTGEQAVQEKQPQPQEKGEGRYGKKRMSGIKGKVAPETCSCECGGGGAKKHRQRTDSQNTHTKHKAFEKDRLITNTTNGQNAFQKKLEETREVHTNSPTKQPTQKQHKTHTKNSAQNTFVFGTNYIRRERGRGRERETHAPHTQKLKTRGRAHIPRGSPRLLLCSGQTAGGRRPGRSCFCAPTRPPRAKRPVAFRSVEKLAPTDSVPTSRFQNRAVYQNLSIDLDRSIDRSIDRRVFSKVRIDQSINRSSLHCV